MYTLGKFILIYSYLLIYCIVQTIYIMCWLLIVRLFSSFVAAVFVGFEGNYGKCGTAAICQSDIKL